jgi:hypothetical protein
VRLLGRGLDRGATVTIDGMDFYGSPKCVLDSAGGWDGRIGGVPAMPGGAPPITGKGAGSIQGGPIPGVIPPVIPTPGPTLPPIVTPPVIPTPGVGAAKEGGE